MALIKILHTVLDAVFPPGDSAVLVRELTHASINACYQPQSVTSCICLSSYQDKRIKALITENKFYTNKRAAQLLAILLDRWLRTQSNPVICVPVPLSRKREQLRGSNQVMQVLQNVTVPLEIRTDLCTRIRDTLPQSSLPRAQRLCNVQHAFVGNQNKIIPLKDVTIVVIDDVVTTGATMYAVRAALAEHLHPSCTLICLGIAH